MESNELIKKLFIIDQRNEQQKDSILITKDFEGIFKIYQKKLDEKNEELKELKKEIIQLKKKNHSLQMDFSEEKILIENFFKKNN